MSDYLTTETRLFEYDSAGRISKQTTVTTEGPDTHVNQWFGGTKRDVVVDIEDFLVRRSGHHRSRRWPK